MKTDKREGEEKGGVGEERKGGKVEKRGRGGGREGRKEKEEKMWRSAVGCSCTL